ncbi:MAG: PTS sugar transporter subunit IIA [Candidatus Brocadiae bacterium]|nr:PTS sugar transporter subunit IIA [Candidatus Brocadiia bacterium]
MNLARYLKPAQIRLELTTRSSPAPEGISPERHRWEQKESVLAEMCELLDATGKSGNKSKLLTDIVNREKKSSTAIGKGVAIPHVRTMQAKELIVAFARSAGGIDFDAPDGEPVTLFFSMVAPPYDDQTYLKIYREIGSLILTPGAKDQLLEAANEHEIIRVFQTLA